MSTRYTKTPESEERRALWVEKAVSKIEESLARSWGDFAADGLRLHYDPTILHIDNNDSDRRKRFMEYIENILKSPQERIALMLTAPFMDAVKAAKKINKKAVVIHLCGKLEVRSRSDISEYKAVFEQDDGYSSKVECEYHIAINPAYLIDALSGMQSSISIDLINVSNAKGLCISDGSRKAVIMPLA